MWNSDKIGAGGAATKGLERLIKDKKKTKEQYSAIAQSVLDNVELMRVEIEEYTRCKEEIQDLHDFFLKMQKDITELEKVQ